MSISQIFKKLLIPCSTGVAAAECHSSGPNCTKRNENFTRPSDLPIYSNMCVICGEVKKSRSYPEIEEAVSNVRKELWVWQDNLQGYRQRIVDSYKSAKTDAKSNLEFFRREENWARRYELISTSALTGYVVGLLFGSRRSRWFLASSGAVGMAALLYPAQTAEYTETALAEGKKHFLVAYHFVCGEMPKAPEWWSKLPFAKEDSSSEAELRNLKSR